MYLTLLLTMKSRTIAPLPPNRADVSKFAPLDEQDWKLKKIQSFKTQLKTSLLRKKTSQKSSGLPVTTMTVVRRQSLL